MNSVTPLIFCDGQKIFQQFIDQTGAHSRGLFILAPSGSGKTHFVQHQKKPNWIDGDKLWTAAGAHPNRAWWLESDEVMDEIDQKSDVITMQAKKLGLWIMGASNNWLIPDAIVIPDWETHQKYIIDREQNNYDGGATSKDFDQVKRHIKWMQNRAAQYQIPIFTSIEEAAQTLEKQVS